MKFTLHIWRQNSADEAGRMARYQVDGISPDLSFLEMLDVLNEQLASRGETPVAFDSDCREGICGMCSVVINGQAHGPLRETTACQLAMRHFEDGQQIYVEPWRAKAFPVIQDLIVDRGAFDRIMEAGGYVTVHSGPKPDPNATPIPSVVIEEALDAAACIGCGACVAACPNGSAVLFVGAKISHLGLLPQGQPERSTRAKAMVQQMDREGFGSCRNYAECEAQCPKGISIKFISRMNRDFLRASLIEPANPRGRLESQ